MSVKDSQEEPGDQASPKSSSSMKEETLDKVSHSIDFSSPHERRLIGASMDYRK